MSEFNMRAVESDPSGYYITRWDRAVSLSIKADNKDEAIKKAKAALGSGSRWPYIFRVDSVTDVGGMEEKRRYKCEGCGVSRPCFVETNQEPDGLSEPIEDLRCILDETNQTSFDWVEVKEVEEK